MVQAIDDKSNSQPVKIAGTDELLCADVKQDTNGDNRLFVDAAGGAAGGPTGVVTIPKFAYLLDGSTKGMNVDGSGTPVEYEFAPGGSDVFFVYAISLFILDPGSTRFDKFGAISALSTGLELKLKTDGGAETLIATIQDNTDLNLMFPRDPSTGIDDDDGWMNESDWYKGTHIFEPTVLKIDGAQSDTIKVIVNDDLTDIKALRVLVHAWKVQ